MVCGFWACYSIEIVPLAKFVSDLHIAKPNKHFFVFIPPDLSIALNPVEHFLILLFCFFYIHRA